MNFDDFQKDSEKLVPKEHGGIKRFDWCPKGLTESAGKIDRLLLNSSFQGESLLTEENANQISEQLGFMLWYCSVLADALDKRLDSIAAEHLRRMQEILKNRGKS